MAKAREAVEADFDAMIALGQALHDESPRYSGMQYDPGKIRTMLGELEGFLMPAGAAFVVEANGEIIGMTVIAIADRFFGPDRFVSDITMYIKPEHRGRGAFIKLVRAIEDWTEKQGIHDIAMGVSTEIHAAETIDVYQRLGYKLTGYTLTKRL